MGGSKSSRAQFSELDSPSSRAGIWKCVSILYPPWELFFVYIKLKRIFIFLRGVSNWSLAVLGPLQQLGRAKSSQVMLAHATWLRAVWLNTDPPTPPPPPHPLKKKQFQNLRGRLEGTYGGNPKLWDSTNFGKQLCVTSEKYRCTVFFLQ